MRFCGGPADDPTARTLRRQEGEAQQLGLSWGEAAAEGLVFRLAVEAEAGCAVSRVVFLVLRGEEGTAECAWEVPLDPPVAARHDAVQLQLIGGEGRDGAEAVAMLRGRSGAGRRPATREPVAETRLP